MRKEFELSSDLGLEGAIETDALTLQWSEAPWDTAVFGYPVIQIVGIEVRGEVVSTDLKPFLEVCKKFRCGLASCRLSHEQLRESILLEDIGFRFIEMLFRPEFMNLQSRELPSFDALEVRRPAESDLTAILEIAGQAFGNERFHMDPRLPSRLGDLRYQNWVRSSFVHEAQRLYALYDENKLVAFFVTEQMSDGTCYWHLNAVSRTEQGRGYGVRAWRSMLHQAQRDGAAQVRTSIAARNDRVLNLYAKLGFIFPKPLMTFHWVAAP